MRRKRIINFFLASFLILLNLASLCLFSYTLILYKGFATFYRIYTIIILVYLFILFSYLALRSIIRKTNKLFIISLILIILFTSAEVFGYYYLNKMYKSINQYSSKTTLYYTSLITYNSKIIDYKDLKDKKIGIINDKSDIEGYILPKEVINKLRLKENNKIIEYDSTMELLHNLKNKNIDVAFFSKNYTEMFSSLEGYENIEKETKVLYTYEKEYTKKEEKTKKQTNLTEPFTMLFIGVDSSKDGVTSGYNADVLLLVTFNPKTLSATMTSIPRDMYLKTACSSGKYRRINTVTWGSSSDCAIKTVEKLFDVKIDYYAKVNFFGVVNLVDAVGGIDVDVPYSFCDQNSARSWKSGIVFVYKGWQHLNGEQTLALVRNRHKPNDGSLEGKLMQKSCPNLNEGDRSDYTRGKNQMKALLGIVKAATEIKDPNKIISILDSVQNNFQTNINSDNILSLYDLASSIVLTDSSNLINVSRSQLNGYSMGGKIYDPSNGSYPSVIIPYNGSINDIKNQIKNNLNNSFERTKNISIDINNLYKDEIIGTKAYSQSRIPTLANLSRFSFSELMDYSNTNNLTITFKDIDSDETLNLFNYENYSFYNQSVHADTILEEVGPITIYVKKKKIESPKPKPSMEEIDEGD